LHCFSGALTAFTNKFYITLQTALSSLLSGAGNGLKTQQHQILQYNVSELCANRKLMRLHTAGKNKVRVADEKQVISL